MSIENIKKVKLGYYPTPIEKLGKITEILGKGDLYIKRDDMTGPAFGGNKTRKLEYLLQEALDTGCTAVLTVGGTQTNHGRTTMGAAIKLGLKPILVLEGKDNGYLSGNLTLDALMGTDIYFVENSEDMPAAIQKVCDKYAAQGDKVYCIPEGGSNTLGAIGYIMSIKEIMEQTAEMGIKLDHIVCTVGSMGTYAGMLLGVKYFNAPFDIIAVPVSPGEKAEKFINFGPFTYTTGYIDLSFQNCNITHTGENLIYSMGRAIRFSLRYVFISIRQRTTPVPLFLSGILSRTWFAEPIPGLGLQVIYIFLIK